MASSAQVYYDRPGVASRTAPAARGENGPMIDSDDLEPKRKAPEQPNFETMSIEELGDHIAQLEEIIAKVREIIAAKTVARGSADAVFK